MVSIAIFGLMNSFDFWLRRREVYHITVMRKFSPLVSHCSQYSKIFQGTPGFRDLEMFSIQYLSGSQWLVLNMF